MLPSAGQSEILSIIWRMAYTELGNQNTLLTLINLSEMSPLIGNNQLISLKDIIKLQRVQHCLPIVVGLTLSPRFSHSKPFLKYLPLPPYLGLSYNLSSSPLTDQALSSTQPASILFTFASRKKVKAPSFLFATVCTT